MKNMKKRIYAGLLAFLMVWSLIPAVEVKAEEAAVSGPEISNVQVSGIGETYVQGEGAELTITAEITDENGLDETQMGVIFQSATDWQTAHLAYFTKQADGSYKATVYIDDPYDVGYYYEPLSNCEWLASHIYATNLKGEISYYEFGTDAYFYVTDANGVCDTTRKSVMFVFSDEYMIETLYSYEVDVTKRWATLEELLTEVPVYESELGFAGWKIGYGLYGYNQKEFADTDRILQPDTAFEVVSSGDGFVLIPAFANKYVSVNAFVLNAEGHNVWTGNQTYMIPTNGTYADLLAVLTAPEEVEGYVFTGWKLHEGVELTDPVDAEQVEVAAVYEEAAAPETPDEPEQPSEPETPDEPEQPSEPETPDEPEQPGEPETPDEPEQPGEPEVPATSDNSNIGSYIAILMLGAACVAVSFKKRQAI